MPPVTRPTPGVGEASGRERPPDFEGEGQPRPVPGGRSRPPFRVSLSPVSGRRARRDNDAGSWHRCRALPRTGVSRGVAGVSSPVLDGR